jgi:hypothetical protein
MEQLPNPLRSDLDQFPDMEELHKNTLFLTGTFVRHLSVWVLLSNDNAQYKYLFPKADGALSNWKSSRLDLSVPLDSQHNEFCCFFSSAVQLITTSTQTLIASARQYSLSYLPRVEHIVSSQLADTTLCQECVCGGYVQQLCYVETIRKVQQPNDYYRNSEGGTTENCKTETCTVREGSCSGPSNFETRYRED